MLRTPEQARAELRRKGVSVTQWAVSNGFSPNLVFEVLSGRRNPTLGQTHRIAVALGLKRGQAVSTPQPYRGRQRQQAQHASAGGAA